MFPVGTSLLACVALHELANGDLGFFGQREEPHPEPIYPVVGFHLPSYIVLFVVYYYNCGGSLW